MENYVGIRCDICGCVVSEAKTVFVCKKCQEADELTTLRARVAELEAAQRWIPVTPESMPEAYEEHRKHCGKCRAAAR